MDVQMKAEFDKGGFSLHQEEEEEILQKCVAYCITLKLSPSDLVSYWEFYVYMNRQINGFTVENGDLDGFLSHLQNEEHLNVYSSNEVDCCSPPFVEEDTGKTPPECGGGDPHCPLLEQVWKSVDENSYSYPYVAPPPKDQDDVVGAVPPIMTDVQYETLRRQISIYASITELLVLKYGHINAASNNLLSYGGEGEGSGQRMTTGSGRQRWMPTSTQFDILEGVFTEGNRTPNKLKIREITGCLLQYGQATEKNVYNWFQNRRAKSKRKHLPPPANEKDKRRR